MKCNISKNAIIGISSITAASLFIGTNIYNQQRAKEAQKEITEIITDYKNNKNSQEDSIFWAEALNSPYAKEQPEIYKRIQRYANKDYDSIMDEAILTDARKNILRSFPSTSYWKNVVQKMTNKRNLAKNVVREYFNTRKTQDSLKLEQVNSFITSDDFQKFLSNQAKQKKYFLKNNPDYKLITSEKFHINATFPYRNISEITQHASKRSFIQVEKTSFNRRLKWYQSYKGLGTKLVSDIKIKKIQPYNNIKTYYTMSEAENGQKILVFEYYGKKNKNPVIAEYIKYAN